MASPMPRIPPFTNATSPVMSAMATSRTTVNDGNGHPANPRGEAIPRAGSAGHVPGGQHLGVGGRARAAEEPAQLHGRRVLAARYLPAQRLGHGSDLVRLPATAHADVVDAQVAG